MREYKYRENINDNDGNTVGVREMVVPNNIVGQIRAEATDDCADKFADILSDIPNLCGTLCPVNCNWGTEENCKTMCKKWLLEKLKEQNK